MECGGRDAALAGGRAALTIADFGLNGRPGPLAHSNQEDAAFGAINAVPNQYGVPRATEWFVRGWRVALTAALAQVFAAGGFNQSVHCIVGVRRARLESDRRRVWGF